MKKFFKAVFALICFLVVFFFASDSRLFVRKYKISSKKINTNLRMIHISDLHSCFYGEAQKNILDKIDEINPDFILLSGDIVDDKFDEAGAVCLIEAVGRKYKCFYSTGNHEVWTGEVERVKNIFRKNGIEVLEGNKAEIEVNGNLIDIFGVDDPEIGEEEFYRQFINVVTNTDKERFTVLISHRPELVEFYNIFKGDVIASGHAHGGQWRIPGVLNGLYAPNQGFFPKYAGGKVELANAVEIISRGLSKENTTIPRIFNRPELVVIEAERIK